MQNSHTAKYPNSHTAKHPKFTYSFSHVKETELLKEMADSGPGQKMHKINLDIAPYQKARRL